jgi:DNA-binding PadR family transcriptional regulator
VFTVGVEIKPTVQKRILEAFIDIAILRALRDQALTGYGINGFFMKNFGATVSPSAVYTNLTAMERKGWIKCVRNSRGRAYDLTQQGQKIVDNMSSIAAETHAFTKKVLGN